HVIGADLHDGVLGGEAVRVLLRVEDAHQGLLWLPVARQRVDAAHQSGEHIGRTLLQILGGHMFQHLSGEPVCVGAGEVLNGSHGLIALLGRRGVHQLTILVSRLIPASLATPTETCRAFAPGAWTGTGGEAALTPARCRRCAESRRCGLAGASCRPLRHHLPLTLWSPYMDE